MEQTVTVAALMSMTWQGTNHRRSTMLDMSLISATK
jgi:hypothetical protein